MTLTLTLPGRVPATPEPDPASDVAVPRPRRPRGRLVLLLGVLAVLLAASVGPPRSGPFTTVPGRDAAAEVRLERLPVPDPGHPGALAHRGGPRVPVRPAAIAPALEHPEDWVPFPAPQECRVADPGPPLLVCGEETPWPPVRRIVVVGDSHAQQYSGALDALAAERHWQVVRMLRGACPFSTASETAPGSPGCIAWNAAARAQILALRPDLVVTTATRDVRIGPTETTPPGFVRAWRELDAAGIRVLAIRDNPRYDRSPVDCVRHEGAGAAGCAVPRDLLLSPVAPYRRLPDVPPNVTFFDPSDHLCTPTTCPPVVGNVLVNFDANHLSATFTRTLGPVLSEQLEPLLAAPAARPDAPRGIGR
ncbi:SGNH hydrolase domain-containing protein [Actinomycetospora lutea]|uniref:SGNH hydrolase domain-containing protein n=1 Tax=Actinomycetospora lutea TaxID=663604 RepID=UPI002367136E|nr:SGNH hydrolase domain-containing protein [Actinomycetospora lutea]MDD7940960.1 SGNH hydrolase domain-containing protein [Actinomycetospora lutea]